MNLITYNFLQVSYVYNTSVNYLDRPTITACISAASQLEKQHQHHR